MRSGDVNSDANLQQRVMPMLRLRPAAWAHARPGVVRTDGSGKISSIETGAPYKFTSPSPGNSPALVTTAGQNAIRSNTASSTSLGTSTIPQAGPCSLIVLWWSAANQGPAARVEDISSGQNEFVRVGYSTTPQAIGSYGGVTQSVSIDNNRPYVASSRADGDNPATFRIANSSQTISSSYSSEDVTVSFLGNCDYFEVAFFTRELSASETMLAEAIMAWSNGFPNALGGAHPFRNRPPLLGD